MLPSGWIKSKLGDVVAFNPKHPAGCNKDQLISFVPMSAVDEHLGQITDSVDRPLRDVWTGYTHFADGDVIFAKITPCMENGKTAIVHGMRNGLACGSTEFYVLRSLGAILPAYLWRYLRQNSFRATAQAQMTGAVGQQRVPKHYLEEYEFSLPPLAEQRRIVARLDALTSRLARTRAELERTLNLAKRFRLRVIEGVFRQFAAGDMARIDEICRVGTGSTPKRGNSRYYHGGTIPWVTSGVVNQDVVSEPTELITKAAVTETNCKVFPAGSLLVALYGEGKTRGKVTRLAIEAATNQALAALYDFDETRVEPEWVHLFLEGRYEETRNQAAGGVQPNLNLGIVKAIQMPVPDIAEQKAALSSIKVAFARADRLEAEAARSRKLLDRLESAILAKAFKGELLPQDPNDEPASVLLDRIRAQRTAAPARTRGPRKRSTLGARNQ